MPSDSNFVHLHVHTDYSLLDGACRIDRLMDRAVAVALVNPPAGHRLWQQAERKILADAPVVPTFNRENVDFIAKRVGNYQYNPQWGPLVDQMWVH